MIGYIFYSHYDYSDVWAMIIGQSNKFLQDKKKYIFTNQIGDFDFDGWEVVLYDETDPYQKRVSSCLERIDEEIVIFHHEDMFLFEQPNFEKINLLYSKVKSGELDLIKFGRAHYGNFNLKSVAECIYLNPSNLSFAIQPTIISKQNLLNIYKATFGKTIWEFETNSCNFVNYMGLKSCFYHEATDKKRGMFHWDNAVYPYVATAVVKGKWDYQSYPEELNKLMIEYKIDPNKRGKNESFNTISRSRI